MGTAHAPRSYRGFTITESFQSKNGTGYTCHTRQGWLIEEFAADGMTGWNSTLTGARDMIDRAYKLHSDGNNISRLARLVDQVLLKQTQQART